MSIENLITELTEAINNLNETMLGAQLPPLGTIVQVDKDTDLRTTGNKHHHTEPQPVVEIEPTLAPPCKGALAGSTKAGAFYPGAQNESGTLSLEAIQEKV